MSPGLPSPPFCRKFTCKARWENWTRQTCRQTSTRSTSSKKIRGPEKSTSSPQGDEEEQWQRQDRKGRCSSVACSALCLKLLLCCCLLSRDFHVALEALSNHSASDGAVGLFHGDGLDRLQSLLCRSGAGQSHFEDRRELNLKFPCLEASSHLNLANSCGNWLDKTVIEKESKKRIGLNVRLLPPPRISASRSWHLFPSPLQIPWSSRQSRWHCRWCPLDRPQWASR